MTHWNCDISEIEHLINKGRVKTIDGKMLESPEDKPKENKYRNVKTEVNGEICDSKKEADYYEQLLWLQRAGEIKTLETQYRILLQEGFVTVGGDKIKPIYYIADFKVTDKDDHVYYVDTKGKRTQVYMIKKKLLLYKYPEIDFREA